MKSEKKISALEFYALVFGLFLGVAILKFGNPIILDHKIIPPASLSEFWREPWPTHWANWIFWPLAIIGGLLVFAKNLRWPASRPLWLLPLLWFGWQIVSATQTVDADLTTATLWQFAGCVACYFLGALLVGNESTLRWLLAGVLAAFVFCLMRAVDQRLVEFPQSRQMLIEGESSGWTNFPPETLLEMKHENVILTTNGMDVANPAILARFAKGRVIGTLVYPNALAGIILLLFPVSLMLAFNSTKRLHRPIRAAVIALTLFLGGSAFFWTGSKLGWLIAIALGGLCLLRLPWPAKSKWIALTTILILGFGIFAVRFQSYFAAGATSASARFNYWQAAAQITLKHPLFGTGPGTFQRPYAQIKSPEAEMARLTHNDYLEQFSDSGIFGGIAYTGWIIAFVATVGRQIWKIGNAFDFAILAGLLAWFAQGLGEFQLYIPALAWMVFVFTGALAAIFQKKTVYVNVITN
jgi:O-antigen ligase